MEFPFSLTEGILPISTLVLSTVNSRVSSRYSKFEFLQNLDPDCLGSDHGSTFLLAV